MKKISLCLLILLLMSQVLYTQEEGKFSVDELINLSLEELMNIKVITSSRKLEKIHEAPNVIYVITSKQIKKRGYKSLADILSTIPGINVFYGDMGFLTQARGIAPNSHNKITYMINSRQINQLTEANLLNGPITLDNAERVEIIVGPGSVLYGAETLLAIVNIITRKDDRNELTFRYGRDLESGSDPAGIRNFSLNTGKSWDENKFVNVSFTAHAQAGWDAFDSVNVTNPNFVDKIGRNIIDKYEPSYFLTATGRYDDYFIQYISYNAEILDVGRTQELGTEGNRIDKVDDLMVQRFIDWNKNLDSRFQINYSSKRFARLTTQGTGTSIDLSQDQYNFEFSLNYKYKNHYLQSGIKYSFDMNRLNYLMRWSPNDPLKSKESSEVQQIIESGRINAYGLYISEEWQVNPKLKLVLAARFDINNIFKNNTVYAAPRLACIYKLNEKWTTKLMYNRSVHMPDTRQSPLNMIFGADKPDGVSPPFAVTNNLARRPEQLSAIEFQNVFHTIKNNISFNFYYQELKDFISWFNPGTNMGDFSGYGFEAEWKRFIYNGYSAWLNFAYTKTDFKLKAKQYAPSSNFPSNNKNESVAVPMFTINGGLDIDFNNNCSLSLIGKYFTRQPAYFLTRSLEVPELVNAKWDYVNNQLYLDATLLFTNIYSIPMDLSLTVKNITNNRDLIAAQYRLYRYKPRGTNFFFTLKYRI